MSSKLTVVRSMTLAAMPGLSVEPRRGVKLAKKLSLLLLVPACGTAGMVPAAPAAAATAAPPPFAPPAAP